MLFSNLTEKPDSTPNSKNRIRLRFFFNRIQIRSKYPELDEQPKECLGLELSWGFCWPDFCTNFLLILINTTNKTFLYFQNCFPILHLFHAMYVSSKIRYLRKQMLYHVNSCVILFAFMLLILVRFTLQNIL